MTVSLQHFYTGFTLVDITATGVVRAPDSISRNQQRNWETVLQTISLGAQPTQVTKPVQVEVNLDYLEFGEFYQGVHQVWAWTFAVEHADVFTEHNNPVGRLEQYFSQVPIISGLTETARFMLPIFYPYGAIKNIYFKADIKNINNI